MTLDMHHFYDIFIVFCILIHFNWMENNDYYYSSKFLLLSYTGRKKYYWYAMISG